MSDYRFDLPSAGEKSIIKVVGVGGGGSNAVTHMFNQGIKDVEFVICNTDAQALKSSPVPSKLQIGVKLTEGLGAGANPEMGMNAAIENKEEIRELLGNDTKMLFVTAGMGGGTGTGAAPVIAQVSKELDILTVGIVTAPFAFEGKRKIMAAKEGIDRLKESCDTVLVISNDKLREIHGNQPIREAFKEADNVLMTAAKSIAEIITVTNDMNVDFKDVVTVMKDSGAAVMGSAVASGDNRAIRAVESALTSPLLNNTDIEGSKKVLLSITYGEQCEMTMDELTAITDYVEERSGFGADVIWGQGVDPILEENLRVTIIATGFSQDDDFLGLNKNSPKKEVYSLEGNKPNPSTAAPKEYQPLGKRPTPSNSGGNGQWENSQSQGYNPSGNGNSQNPQGNFEANANRTYGGYEVVDVNQQGGHQPSSNQNYYYQQQQERERLERERREAAMQQLREMQERQRRYVNQSPASVMKNSSNPDADSGQFRHMENGPAYLRRNVNLDNLPSSNDNNVSRLTLSEDNEVLGNNRFLHDNVD